MRHPPLADPALQVGILRRIDVVQPAGEHSHRAVLHRGFVGGRIDAAGKAGGDDVARAADAGSKHAGKLLAGRRAVAGTDDGDHRTGETGYVALDVQQRRRRFERGERWRVARLDSEERARSYPVGSLEFGPRLRLRADAYRLAAAAVREVRQRCQCRPGAAEVIDELAEGDGTDMIAADKAQARQALGGIERRLRQGRRRQSRARLRIGLTGWRMTGHRSCSPHRQGGA